MCPIVHDPPEDCPDELEDDEDLPVVVVVLDPCDLPVVVVVDPLPDEDRPVVEVDVDDLPVVVVEDLPVVVVEDLPVVVVEDLPVVEVEVPDEEPLEDAIPAAGPDCSC